MEKKAYIQPIVTIVTVGPQNMIAFSNTNVGLGVGDTDGEIEEADVKANNYSVWDDDWSK